MSKKSTVTTSELASSIVLTIIYVVILILSPFDCILQISLPVSIINLILNLPPLFILRYNTPKLFAGYKRLLKTQNASFENFSHENLNNTI